ncbi:type I-G CRISPR-associated protein Csb2 [Planctomicrobium sp. SH527]|uniref:type I-G CRISPR-associated protein Csb2 n=1 Tax=Planctomicrobium sp. SH527 TaxID=3448123 RepID=UPI003F5C7A14
MADFLRISVQFLEPLFHGRGEGGRPEWPPSPLRLFQAIVATCARKYPVDEESEPAQAVLKWLEGLPAPVIFTPVHRPGKPYRLYCPDNLGDRVAASWCRGGEASLADSRTEKDIRPTHLLDQSEISYVWHIEETSRPLLNEIRDLVNSVSQLGWGVDQVVADADELSMSELSSLPGVKWVPDDVCGGTALRCPAPGTLQALIRRHGRFLRRISVNDRGEQNFNPVPALTTFRLQTYRPASQVLPRPFEVFQLQGESEGQPFSYPQSKLIHIAGMVRHLAIQAMQRSPPRDVDERWVESFVAGHVLDPENHRQFSYLPLPSIGKHADHDIRRVMIVGPHGSRNWLTHLTNLLAGQRLEATSETRWNGPPTLVHVKGDGVTRCYTTESRVWASATPVILPGHDDHRPAKTRKLIEKALLQSGIDQECQYEWSPFPYFPKSLTAHKYGKDKQPTGYIRPNHLLNQTAVHLKLTFEEQAPIPGPLTIGAGRHCGLGLMARVMES